MRTLFLGGNRYIGLHAVFELARQGHDVTIVNSHEAPMPEGARRLPADRRQPGALVEVLAPLRDEFDVVYDNTAYAVSDLEPLVELFRGRVEQYVFTSSVAAYKRNRINPVTEDFPRHAPGDRDARKAYGVGKVECEDYLRAEFERTGFPTTSLRVTHTFGPNTPLATREPAFFARLEQGRPIPIPADGFPFVHLVHVQDVARLMVAVAGCAAAAGEAYNVAGGEWASIASCIHLMAKVVGVEANIVNVPLAIARRAHPPLVHWGEGVLGGTVYSIERARAQLGWEPSFDLERGYRDSYEWFRAVGRERFEFDFSADESVLKEMEAS